MICAPELLAVDHELVNFDCGQPGLNLWLKKKALKAQQVGGSARTYVVCEGDCQVVGFYSLATGAVNREDVSGKVRRNMPDPIPVVLLARLAVDVSFQGRGIGPGLLKDALLRVVGAAEEIGIRAVLVHALNQQVTDFYRKHGFYESPTQPQTLMLTVQEIQKVFQV